MLTDLDQMWADFTTAIQSLGLLKGALFVLFFFAIWFLPAIIALFRNRRHLGKIFVANIPAIVSWVAWLALIVWAFTGKSKRDGGENSGRAAADKPAA